MANSVIGALRRFLPAYLAGEPALNSAQRRAIWALEHCRTPLMGGHLWDCGKCGRREYHCHSCNHRSCPQCGRADTADWVNKQLDRRVGAPYFMVTFTLPQPLRKLFFTPAAKPMYDLFFTAAAEALRPTLAGPRWLGAKISGFSLIQHTWNQRLHFHPHLHAIVPGAGIAASGRVVAVKRDNFLVPQRVLRRRFAAAFRAGLERMDTDLRDQLPDIEPQVWRTNWGVHLQAFGNGENIIKYLGAYVCRTAIGDRRIVSVTDTQVTFTWKDRAHGGVQKKETLPGAEFVARYLRHVLPTGLKAVRHYGFCHPSAAAKRQRIAFHTGRELVIAEPAPPAIVQGFRCACCGTVLRLAGTRLARWKVSRAPPASPALNSSQ